ncbi:hypothetical protein TNCV_1412031 [Trichonephila clavipes]|nr:hypothetical protein TNCV_1412031 [Trichonephila clavipes]
METVGERPCKFEKKAKQRICHVSVIFKNGKAAERIRWRWFQLENSLTTISDTLVGIILDISASNALCEGGHPKMSWRSTGRSRST